MNLKEIVLLTWAALAVATPVSAAKIKKVGEYTFQANPGKSWYVQTYKIKVEKGDTFDSIVQQLKDKKLNDYYLTLEIGDITSNLVAQNPRIFNKDNNCHCVHKGQVLNYEIGYEYGPTIIQL